MVKLVGDYVKVYENTLPSARCNALIERFEADAALHERMEAERSYSFAEINVSKHWPEVEAEIFTIMIGCIEQYWRALKVGGSWPKQVDAERVRLKRYLPDGKDKFPTHVDVMNAEQSKRFLTAILYLNEPGGGETVFPHLDLVVKPAPGRMVVFPPLWLFPHAGMPPKDRAKYILHRYLWYPHESVSPSTP